MVDIHRVKKLFLKWGFLALPLSHKAKANLYYHRRSHRYINWKNPTELNEWINVLKFTPEAKSWTELADKYRVRAHVEKLGLGDMLVPLLGAWESAEEIDFEKLPNSFVLKSNDGCATVKIVKDKTKESEAELRELCHQWMSKRYGSSSVELHYKGIPRKIIAEKLLDAAKQAIPSDSLIDYKIWCFNGEPYLFFIIGNRHKDSIEVQCFDTEWNKRDDVLVYSSHIRKPSVEIPKPKSFDRMMQAARILAKGHPQVRVDLYEIDGKPYFGELTFTSAAGFMDYFTNAALYEMGSLIKYDL